MQGEVNQVYLAGQQLSSDYLISLCRVEDAGVSNKNTKEQLQR